jgi:hypothetical protein
MLIIIYGIFFIGWMMIFNDLLYIFSDIVSSCKLSIIIYLYVYLQLIILLVIDLFLKHFIVVDLEYIYYGYKLFFIPLITVFVISLVIIYVAFHLLNEFHFEIHLNWEFCYCMIHNCSRAIYFIIHSYLVWSTITTLLLVVIVNFPSNFHFLAKISFSPFLVYYLIAYQLTSLN